TLARLREAAAGCRACDLWKRGTQTVFGEGAVRSAILLVGEQPGNDEDLAGRPFVGPAGKLLDRALEAAGIDRRRVYRTHVVKHFKWVAQGKRRIHQKPNARDRRVPAVARGRDRRREAARDRLPRRDGGAGRDRPHVPREPPARRARPVATRTGRRRDGPSV